MSNGDKCVCGDKETWHKKCYAEQAEASSLSDLLSLRQLLNDINDQATRKERACSLKKYLVWDLEFIAKMSTEAKVLIDKLSAT